jgi:hypothetical protein
LIKSKNQIGDGNSLWKYFGMRLTAILEESKNPTEEMMKYLVDRIDSLKHSDNEENKKIDKTEQFTITVIDDKMSRQKLIELVTSECNLKFIKFDGIHSQDDRIIFKINNDCDAFWLNKCYAALCESLKGCQVLLNT